jgi:CRP/FNR family transcriptional regulator
MLFLRWEVSIVNLVDEIAAIPLFDGLSKSHREGLAQIVLEKEFKKGHTIFSEGESGYGFYVVVDGRVKVYKLSPDGKEQILHLFGPGEPFGEVPVFSGQVFPAYAETLVDSRLLMFPRDEFLRLLGNDPTLALSLLAVLSKRLRQLTALIENLSLKEVPGRLAAYILSVADEENPRNITMDISKGQLASLLGTIPETLSRIWARMLREGYIEEINSRSLRILDFGALRELAEGVRRLA